MKRTKAKANRRAENRKARDSKPSAGPAAGACGVTLARAPGIGLVVGTSVGRWSRQNPVVLKIRDEEIVGAVEEPADFGALCAKIGLLVVAALTNTPPALGPDAILKGLTKWAAIDVEALRAELVSEAEALGDVPPAGDGPVAGDLEVPADPEGSVRLTDRDSLALRDAAHDPPVPPAPTPRTEETP